MKEVTNPLEASVQYLKGVGPKLGQVLAKKGIATLEDALYFLPRSYEDRSRLTRIGDLVPQQSATVYGRVTHARSVRAGRRLSFEATISDGTGSLVLYWFHAYPSIKDEFAVGRAFLAHGQVDLFAGRYRMAHPDYEPANEQNGKPVASANFGRVVPVYSESEGLHQKTIRKVVASALKLSLPHLEDALPAELRKRHRLPALRDSFLTLHYPRECPKEGELPEAARRVIFEEFFCLHLGLLLKRKARQAGNAPVLGSGWDAAQRFIGGLPFQLTSDQREAIARIAADLATPVPMTRLVQGDVGSGKTVVAFAAAAIAAASGYQAALMAPTEILAEQHFHNASRWLEPLGIRPCLLTGSTSSKKAVRDLVAGGEAAFVVGTHAVFQHDVAFSRLGLVIVDEQHRFGVAQRHSLVQKGERGTPHLLMMTATPIPRTLALTVYGDLDVTIIREKPAGRSPVKTSIMRDRDRPTLYQKIRRAVERGEQVYVIYPLIEASETLDLKSATEMHHRFQREIFPEFQIALLHGRMKAEEKDQRLKEFREKKYQILISTTVIEVGIDVPNATLMVIEHPERLGLSQLHQLRGRVGRGALESECILVAGDSVSPRLRVMEGTEDGFVIAEEDLKLRGPGEFMGTRQSGLPGFRVADLLRDAKLLVEARDEAERILARDPDLSLEENAGIRLLVESRWREKFERLRGV